MGWKWNWEIYFLRRRSFSPHDHDISLSLSFLSLNVTSFLFSFLRKLNSTHENDLELVDTDHDKTNSIYFIFLLVCIWIKVNLMWQSTVILNLHRWLLVISSTKDEYMFHWFNMESLIFQILSLRFYDSINDLFSEENRVW